MGDNYKIIAFSPALIDQAAALEALTFSLPWSRESFADMTSHEKAVWLAAVDITTDKLIGYAGAFRVLDEADIVNVAVAAEYRRQGIAEALVRELLSRLGGVRNVYLEVRQSNTAARALYQKLGFRDIAIRRDYYDEPREDAVCMRLAQL